MREVESKVGIGRRALQVGFSLRIIPQLHVLRLALQGQTQEPQKSPAPDDQPPLVCTRQASSSARVARGSSMPPQAVIGTSSGGSSAKAYVSQTEKSARSVGRTAWKSSSLSRTAAGVPLSRRNSERNSASGS